VVLLLLITAQCKKLQQFKFFMHDDHLFVTNPEWLQANSTHGSSSSNRSLSCLTQ
jgi:hypothetical protein